MAPALRLGRLFALLALFILPAAVIAAVPDAGRSATPDPFVGQLLIAPPDIGDPRFNESVILMVRHDKTGAFGIIINRPIEERTIASLLNDLGDHDEAVQGKLRIFAGGPVEPTTGFVVHSADYHRPETIAIDGRVAVTSSAGILHDIGHGVGPKKYFLAFGYAGWGPGQLEAEMAQHAWFTIPENQELLFDDDRDIVWKEALEHRTRSL